MARAARGGRKTITPETGISGSFKDTEYKTQGSGYDGPQPPAGLYPMKLTSVGQHTTSDTAIVWTFDITSGQYEGWRGWMYSDMANAKWKTQNIAVALGLIEPNEEISMSYEQILKEAGPVRGRVVREEYEEAEDEKDRWRSKISSVIKATGTTAASDDEDEDEDDEDFDDEPKKSAPARRGRRQPDPEPEDDEDDDEEEEEAPEPPKRGRRGAAKAEPATPEIDLEALEEELEGMTLRKLKAKAKEFGVTAADMKDADEDDLIDLILEKAEEQNPSF